MIRHAATWAVFLAWWTAGCTSMSIETTPLVQDLAPIESENCATRLFTTRGGFLDQCEKIAEMTLGDSGFTLTKYCGAIQVRDAVRAKTCEIGGNAAVIVRGVRPMMTCVEARATLYRCDPAQMPERPSWATSTANAAAKEE